MAKFKFRLATLLRLRETARDERRGKLAEAYRADDILRQQMDQVDQELSQTRAGRRDAAGPGTVVVDRLVESHRYEAALSAQRSHLDAQHERLAEEIERRRQALVAADREVRVLEKLRDRQLERHRDEENRREAKRLDEVAVLRAAAQSASREPTL